MKLTKKEKFFKRVHKQTNPFGERENGWNIISFLGRIWELDKMPSTDSRYKDAFEDIQ